MGKIKETASRWYNKLFPKEEQRGVGGAIARKDDSGSFGRYYGSIIARAGLPKSFSDFNEELLNTLPDDKVRELTERSSPIAAKAVADYSDAMSSGGYSLIADKTNPNPDNPAQRLLDDFVARLERDHGGLEQIIADTARGMFTHGGAFWELVIGEDKLTPVTIKVLNPATAKFRRAYDKIIGEYYELGQDIGYNGINEQPIRRVPENLTTSGAINFISFHDEPTIQYRALQGGPNNPYGTPIIDPAVFHVQMMAGFFSSFKDALTGHVWPNLLITIDEEKFKKTIGVSRKTDTLQKKLDDATKSIRDSLKKLKPGDALVQSDAVDIGGSITGTNKAPLGSIKDIQDVIRRELIIAVQSQPIFMGSNEAIAETHAVEQRKAYAQLIRRGQKVINGLMTEFLNFILQINGFAPLAEFKLAYVNTADYKDQAATYLQFREGLLKGSEDMIKMVEALEAAKAAKYLTEAEAKEMFDHELEIRRQVDILPQDL